MLYTVFRASGRHTHPPFADYREKDGDAVRLINSIMKNETTKKGPSLFRPKLLDSFKGYSGKTLLYDLTAGLIVAAIALPLSITAALASGVSPERGIYTAAISGFVAALLGGSRINISGSSIAFAALSAGIVSAIGIEGLMIATILAGILLVLMGLLKWGRLIGRIPPALTAGLTAGLALTIAIGQIKDFFGLTFAPGSLPVTTVERICALFQNAATLDWQNTLVGGVCLILLILLPRINKRIPAAPIALVAGVLMVLVPELLESAELIDGFKFTVNTVGDLYVIEGGLPAFSLPTVKWTYIPALLPAALAIALLSGTRSLFCCAVSDNMTDDPSNPNTELIAQGLGNVLSGLFGGIPACGSVAKTAANVKNGGKTPVAGIIHALILLIVLWVLMPFAGYIPLPAVSAILFVAAYELCGRRRLTAFFKSASKSELALFALTLLFTLLFDLTIALLAGAAGATAVRILGKKTPESNCI